MDSNEIREVKGVTAEDLRKSYYEKNLKFQLCLCLGKPALVAKIVLGTNASEEDKHSMLCCSSRKINDEIDNTIICRCSLPLMALTVRNKPNQVFYSCTNIQCNYKSPAYHKERTPKKQKIAKVGTPESHKLFWCCCSNVMTEPELAMNMGVANSIGAKINRIRTERIPVKQYRTKLPEAATSEDTTPANIQENLPEDEYLDNSFDMLPDELEIDLPMEY